MNSGLALVGEQRGMSASTKVLLEESRLPDSGAGAEQYVAAQPVHRRIYAASVTHPSRE